MRILSAIQAIFAAAFLLIGFLALFGIGITGLLFLVPGGVFAATAAYTQEKARVAVAIALAVDLVLAYMAAGKLEALLASERTGINLHHTVGALGSPSLFDYLPAAFALVLIGIGAFAVIMDWRTLRDSPWF